MIIIDLPELLQIVIISYLIQGLRIQRFSMSPDWIQLFSSQGHQCLHPVYKSSATHVQKLPVIKENFSEYLNNRFHIAKI